MFFFSLKIALEISFATSLLFFINSFGNSSGNDFGNFFNALLKTFLSFSKGIGWLIHSVERWTSLFIKKNNKKKSFGISFGNWFDEFFINWSTGFLQEIRKQSGGKNGEILRKVFEKKKPGAVPRGNRGRFSWEESLMEPLENFIKKSWRNY